MRRPQVRPATEDDVAAIAAVTAATGQDDEWGGANPLYVLHLLRHGTVAVAELAGQVLGFGATQQVGTAGGGTATMLCDLYVHPAEHGRGCGRAVLSSLLREPGPRLTFASLHAHAGPLYTRFGMDAWWPLLYLHGDPARLPLDRAWHVTQASPVRVTRHEVGWTGAARLDDYEAWSDRPDGQCVLASRDGEVLAAGALMLGGSERGIVRLTLAPAADDDAAAGAVVAVLAVLGRLNRRLAGPARVCLPGPHPAVRVLLAAGWRWDEFDLHMASEPGLLDARRAVPSPAQA
jgi:ribosomal protein S18 acetylase RimI-like enzyme